MTELKWYEWKEIHPSGTEKIFDARLELPIYDNDTEEEIQRVYDWWKALCKKHNYTGIGAM
jgi:hypothetical protein